MRAIHAIQAFSTSLAGGVSHVAVPIMFRDDLLAAFAPGLLVQPILLECGELVQPFAAGKVR